MAKKTNTFRWLLAFVAVLAAVIYYQAGRPQDKLPSPAVPGYDIEKTGAGVVLDFTETSVKIHAAVDSVLKNEKLTVKETKETKREVARTEVEGMIRWHARSLLVTLPDNISADMLDKALISLVTQAGGKVIGSEPDNYNGSTVVRIDVGIKDTLNSQPLTMVTDRIYLAKDAVKTKEALPVKPKSAVRQGDMAIIIDDFGTTREPIADYIAMGRPLTFAVLPYLPYSHEAAAAAISAGHLVMLHLPLEPLSATAEVEPTVIRVEMSDQEIRQIVTKAIAAIPGLKGVNNHQGSKATADRRVMNSVLGVVKAHNLFFVDSRTNSKSVATEVSRIMGIRTGENELFLDNSPDVDLIKKQLRKAIAMAQRNGSVTVIGHARPDTVTAVRQMIPEIEAAGIRLVYANQLLR